MKFNSFPGIVKFLRKDLPTNDYPVLNSRLFCSIWFTSILDMRALRLAYPRFLRQTRQETHKFLGIFIINYCIILRQLILKRG